MKGKIVALLGIIGFILLVTFLSADKSFEVAEQQSGTGEVSTGSAARVTDKIFELREKQGENDIEIMHNKQRKAAYLKDIEDIDADIIQAREENRQLEQQITAFKNPTEQEVIYESTGAATSGEAFQ